MHAGKLDTECSVTSIDTSIVYTYSSMLDAEDMTFWQSSKVPSRISMW